MRIAALWFAGVGGLVALLVLVGGSTSARGDKDTETPKEKIEAFQKLSLDEALKKAKKDEKIVMVDFYADWCGPCKLLDKKTWTDEKVQSFLKDKTVAVKIDVDDAEDLAKKYKIKSIPAMVFIKADGTEVGRIVGYVPGEDFLKQAADILAEKKSEK